MHKDGHSLQSVANVIKQKFRKFEMVPRKANQTEKENYFKSLSKYTEKQGTDSDMSDFEEPPQPKCKKTDKKKKSKPTSTVATPAKVGETTTKDSTDS